MPKMVLVITTKIERGLEVAEAWEELGAPGEPRRWRST